VVCHGIGKRRENREETTERGGRVDVCALSDATSLSHDPTCITEMLTAMHVFC
jgi:hypothetical protein